MKKQRKAKAYFQAYNTSTDKFGEERSGITGSEISGKLNTDSERLKASDSYRIKQSEKKKQYSKEEDLGFVILISTEDSWRFDVCFYVEG